MNQLIEFLHRYFVERNWKWSIKDKGLVEPTKKDFRVTLDEARRVMYSEPVGAILEIGRLVIIKQNKGLDIYVLAGTITQLGEK